MSEPKIKIRQVGKHSFMEVAESKEPYWFRCSLNGRAALHHESGYGFLYEERFEVVK